MKGVDESLRVKLDEIGKRYPEVEDIERNIEPDHVHRVMSFAPKYSIGRVVQMMKQNTGRGLKEKIEFLRERYWGSGGIGSVGYFVSTVGLDEDAIRG